jgi:hypothetical protein
MNNPVVNQNAKREVLSKTLESQVNAETFFFNDFSQKNRINVLEELLLLT